ncbi:MAG TPA: beta-N-acetylhexosaminidase [Bacteroidetes bacterium]|nr:beta-N-acetylhexosaminidase [Bacteroidota bacterium]
MPIMKAIRFLLPVIGLCLAVSPDSTLLSMQKNEPAIAVIPKPLSMKKESGTFNVSRTTVVAVDEGVPELRRLADDLSLRLRTATGFPVPVVSKSGSNAIRLAIVSDSELGDEGYRLSVSKKAVVIEAGKPAGVFYGVQTLLQLLPPDVEKSAVTAGPTWSIPCVRIEDKPRFPWRGMHLDVGRHFFSKDSVKRYIDMMASYKMNTFHWHLTEDQGWRIEIKKYPRLTSVSAWRRESNGDGIPHGGFYSRDEVREVVQYAKDRFITVVPEIEMPGHSQAALAGYPELSCSGGPFKVGTDWGVINDVFCAGNEKTFKFLEDVIDEVTGLFPGAFLHIGGDECPKLRWSNCKRCQDRIAGLGLKNEDELQSYFIKRIEGMLNARGKRLVGWDEILEGGLAPNATVMSWRGIKGGIEAAKSGHDVVMTPTSYCYFDYYQGAVGEPAAMGGFLPIDSVYAYEPVPDVLTAEEAHHILGAQGNVWTEWIPDYRHAEYMATTRMMALSEVVWSAKSRRNFEDFLRRIIPHYQRLSNRDINYRVPTPLGVGGRKIILRDTVAAITSPVPGATIYYTLDGSDPTPGSAIYSSPIAINGDRVLKASLQFPGSRMSNPITTAFLTVDPALNGLRFEYFEGGWDFLPDLRIITPVKTGVTYDIGLGGVPTRGRNYGLVFKGTMTLPADGEYTFFLLSDDGSKLFIDGKEFINNDGLHGSVEVSSKASFARGMHSIEVRYFQRGGGQDLGISIEGPGFAKQLLPPRLLSLQ